MLDAVDPHREKFGLKKFAELRAEGGGEKENLLIQQKTETVDALSRIAQPCPGIPEVNPSLASALFNYPEARATQFRRINLTNVFI